MGVDIGEWTMENGPLPVIARRSSAKWRMSDVAISLIYHAHKIDNGS